MGKIILIAIAIYFFMWWLKRINNISSKSPQSNHTQRVLSEKNSERNDRLLQRIGENTKKKNQQYIPRQIDLENIPYIPLPPSPAAWQNHATEIKADNELFKLDNFAHCKLEAAIKLENSEKPDLFYKQIRLTSDGSLFIDSYGKNEKYPGCKASLMKRNKDGIVIAEAGLKHDIYRIATSPLHEYCGFMSTEGVLHAYNGKLENIFEHSLSKDLRILAHYESTLPTWGTLKTHIRTIDLSNDGSQFLFTIVDTAWCIDRSLNGLWGISLPLNEGWERIVHRTTAAAPRADVIEALAELELELPVIQEKLKKQYRELALKWHPDRNKDLIATEKMQRINDAFAKLTGVDPNSLQIREKILFDYHKKPDYTFDVHGMTFSVSLQIGSPQDWIYASGFAADSKHTYLGSYAGKIVRINQNGEPSLVYDVSNTPKLIIDTDDYLYIQTYTRLYILKNGEDLIDIVDLSSNEKLIVGDKGFGLLGEKHLTWHNEDGKKYCILSAKNPIRAVYPSRDAIVVETRQHRVILSLTELLN